MGEPKPRRLDVADHVSGVLAGDRAVLARTITLVESSSAAHAETAESVLAELMPHTGRSIRVGITGVPGVGKSTFIEALGTMLCAEGHRVAVLAVDPSSTVTGGSILGDKTRMERLSREQNAFIRPSPAAGTLGGVTRRSRETILLCEAAGFDVVLVETVGVGQSETAVRSMVDFFLLLLLPGAGDELQGIKKGVIELADALVVNKADGDTRAAATRAQAEYGQALRYVTSPTDGWDTRAHHCSALTGEGVPEVWRMIRAFERKTKESGAFERRRSEQALHWVHSMIEERLLRRFFTHPAVRDARPGVEAAVRAGTLPASTAARILLEAFDAAGK